MCTPKHAYTYALTYLTLRVHNTHIHRYTKHTHTHTTICTHIQCTHTQHIHTPNTYMHCLSLSPCLSLSVYLSHTYSYEKWLIRLLTAIISQYEHLPKDLVVHTACIHQSTSAKQGKRPERAVLWGTNHELTFAICRLLGTSLAR